MHHLACLAPAVFEYVMAGASICQRHGDGAAFTSDAGDNAIAVIVLAFAVVVAVAVFVMWEHGDRQR
jgi:hypothetical protein